MKKPRLPPNTIAVMESLLKDGRRFAEVMTAVASPSVDGRYLHWDELVYRKAPDGLSHEEWWYALKTLRVALYKRTPLHGVQGEPFQFLQTDPIPESLHHIDQRAGGFIQMPEPITNPETRDQYYVSSLIEEAITSSQLEGASTTGKVAKEMIRSGRAPRDRSEQMILNNFVTMRRIGEIRREPLTRELVLDIHRLITDRTLDNPSAAGRFRTTNERIVVGDEYGAVFHDPPPADQLEARLAAMCDFANGKDPDVFIHPVIRSIILHFWLAYDHPFVDGNGRTARALFYWSMLRHGYWLFEFVSISHILRKAPTQYGRAFLFTETDDNDLTYFILHQLKVIHRAIEELQVYLERKTRELRSAEQSLRALAAFNHRQRVLLTHALRHPNHRYTVESHRLSHNVVYETARTDLLHLRDSGLLIANKVGRTWYFTPAIDLEKRLEKTRT